MLKIIANYIFWYYGINTFACGLYGINIILYYCLWSFTLNSKCCTVTGHIPTCFTV